MGELLNAVSFQFAGVPLLKSTVHFRAGLRAVISVGLPARVCHLASGVELEERGRPLPSILFTEFSDAGESESKFTWLKGL